MSDSNQTKSNTSKYPYLREILPYTNSSEHFEKRNFIFDAISTKVKEPQFTLFDMKVFLEDYDPAYKVLTNMDPLLEQA